MLLRTKYQPLSIIFIRIVIASIILSIIAKAFGKLQKIQKGDFKWFLLMATLEPFLYFIGETYGIQITASPTLAAVMISTVPLFSPFAAYYFYKERIGLQNYIGIALSVIGVCTVIFHNGMEEVNAQIVGILLLLIAVASSLFYSIVIKKLADNYNPFTIISYQNIIGIISFLPLFLFIDYKNFITIPFSIQNVYPFFMLALFASGVAFILFVYVIKEIGVVRSNIFVTLIPVITAIFCFILGTEKISFLRTIGICLVVTGLILSQLKSHKSH
jgi:drug/metabolite transporter (DMT)-like permease